MIEILEDLPPGVLGFRPIGTVTAEDYRNVLDPALEAAVSRYGKTDLVLVIDYRLQHPRQRARGLRADDAGPFRLVGGTIADLCRADLRGQCLLQLWRPNDRWQLKSALEYARRRPEPVVVHADLLADGVPPLAVEILHRQKGPPVGVAHDHFLA